MGLKSRSVSFINALLANSGSINRITPERIGSSIDSPNRDAMRAALGNHLSLRPMFQTEWLMNQYEAAIQNATNGNIENASLLWKWCLTDSTLRGVHEVFCSGVASLPRRWRGPQYMIDRLEVGRDSVTSVFDQMVPPDQLKLLISDYKGLGVAFGTLEPVPGRERVPVLQRVDPTFIRYRWADPYCNWYYNSTTGPIALMPGDGRVVMLTAGNHAEPWMRGLWNSAGRTCIIKNHAQMASANFERTLANPFVFGKAPPGASIVDRENWFGSLDSWGYNNFAVTAPGFDVEILQANGTGYECFSKTIERCDHELIRLVCGNLVSTEGNSGFSSASIYETIREDLIRATAQAVADVVNTQVLPVWVALNYGIEKLSECPKIEFETTAPRDPTALAQSWLQACTALDELTARAETLDKYGLELDLKEIITKTSLPVKVKAQEDKVYELTDGEFEDVDLSTLDDEPVENVAA